METKFEIVPVPTRILTHHDDIVEAIVEYGGDKIGPDDVVCVAESVVAITQGGAKRSEDFKPGLLAKVLCRLFPSKGSISGWHSMQALIDAEGGMRVLIAVICGFAAKCVGVSGVFYRMAGEQARLIDDVTGTMPFHLQKSWKNGRMSGVTQSQRRKKRRNCIRTESKNRF